MTKIIYYTDSQAEIIYKGLAHIASLITETAYAVTAEAEVFKIDKTSVSQHRIEAILDNLAAAFDVLCEPDPEQKDTLNARLADAGND